MNHSVEASGGQIGVRWYEFHAPPLSITPPYRRHASPVGHLRSRLELPLDGLNRRGQEQRHSGGLQRIELHLVPLD